MKIELLPFGEELIPQAGDLLAQTHRRDRISQSCLPVEFEDAVFAQEAIRQESEQARSTGVAALLDGHLLGFIIGKTILDQLWDRSAWVSLAGCALSPEQNAGLIGWMYASLGSQWVANGRIVPGHCIELSVAGSFPQFQGLGIVRALTRHGLVYAYEQGYRNCLTDWRSTDLLASRFWPALGFQPVAYRLTRRIDTRIAWANG